MGNRHKQAFAEHLLNNMTWPERILWSRLRHKQIGYSFQRQAIVLGFIVDFWCPTARVVVEVDGDVHLWPSMQEADQRKDIAFAKVGIDCLRFPNEDIREGMSAVLLRIWEHCYQRAPIRLKPFLFQGIGDSPSENVEMSGIRQSQDDKRMEQHAQDFSRRYWARKKKL